MDQYMDNFQTLLYIYIYIHTHGYNPEEEIGPSLAQICQEDEEKTEEQGSCMGEDMLLKDNTNKMFRFTILPLQTVSYVSVKTGSEGDSNK